MSNMGKMLTLPLSARGFVLWRVFSSLPRVPVSVPTCLPQSRGPRLLTVSIFHPSVVAFLPKADVSQVQDPRHDLQHQLLVLAPDADDLHGVLGARGARQPLRRRSCLWGCSSRALTMVSWKSLRSSVPSTWYVSDWFR